MLRVGLTGGIGAGKSTVARRLVELGAVLVDADALAREVVAPGTPGLAAVLERFGPGVLTAGGELDRPALGRLVFGDEGARAALNAIVHPLVAARRAELAAAAPADAVVVEDVPLLVETGAAPGYPLVVVVEAPEQERVRRLVEERGMREEDARARLAAQAGDEQRRAAADVLLANPRRPQGAPDPLPALVARLWHERLLPFEANLRARRPAPRPAGAPAAGSAGERSAAERSAAERSAAVARLRARVARAAGERALSVEPDGPAGEVLRVRVVVADEASAGSVAEDLLAAGLVRLPGRAGERSALAVNADPGQAVDCRVQPAGARG
ncbi:dephospho-CoA kinase [Kineococcus sp. SYSU DK006]|uniref:dephospho-CoA kinase n=1 Tax=Kineococcus sp. SYSU DK006 TaxID=3383127 RepID=UPI003D7DF631